MRPEAEASGYLEARTGNSNGNSKSNSNGNGKSNSQYGDLSTAAQKRASGRNDSI
jgi:hypothetical protein